MINERSLPVIAILLIPTGHEYSIELQYCNIPRDLAQSGFLAYFNLAFVLSPNTIAWKIGVGMETCNWDTMTIFGIFS